jgi:lipoprotein-anchoring transpeptidase ErfK/SrfK
MYYYRHGKLTETLEMALGQDPAGHKQQTGDNKTPEGEYRISQKAKGPFYSDTGPYLGNSWMELSYPNRFDAYEGLNKGMVSQAQAALIIKQDLLKQRTPHNTRLGGLVGIHGWNGEWHPNYRDITWGCISLQNADIDRLYPHFPVNMYVLIVP